MTYTETIQAIHHLNHMIMDPRISKATRRALTTQREELNMTLR